MGEGLILVVDDDPKIVELVAIYLRRAGFDVVTAPDGLEAQRVIREEQPQLVVLDVMLPGLDGLELTRSLRDRHDSLPVLMVSARGAVDDRLQGLIEGADDYLAKPFSPAELVERTRAILRRSAGARSRQLTLHDLRVDLERHRVDRAGERVELSPTEYGLLVALLRAGGRVLTREQLLDALHGLADAEVDARAIDVHMSRLRAKLGDSAGGGRYIATVRGTGYRTVALQP